MKDEIEIIRHPHIGHMNLFMVEIDYRNPHLHRDFELDLILSGKVSLITHGTGYPLGPGDIVLINPSEAHEIRTEGGGATILCLQISPRILRETVPAMGHLSFDPVKLRSELNTGQMEDLRSLFVELAYQYTVRTDSWQLLCGSLLDLLVYFLLRHVPFQQLSDEERRSNKKRTQRLTQIIHYVEENYMQKILLSDIARLEGLSMGYLSHFIRDNLNQSFQDYVSSVRLEHAKRLLLSNNRLIDVSMDAGFSDPRYMTKAFLKFEGCTPGQYRCRHTGENNSKVRFSSETIEQYFPEGRMLAILNVHRTPLGLLTDRLLRIDEPAENNIL